MAMLVSSRLVIFKEHSTSYTDTVKTMVGELVTNPKHEREYKLLNPDQAVFPASY